MDLLIRGLPAILLLVTGPASALGGLMLPAVGRATIGGNGQVAPGFVEAGAALFIGGITAVWVAWGVWRSKLWRTRIATLLSAAALAYLTGLFERSVTPHLQISKAATLRIESASNGWAGPLAVAIVVYVTALACLLVAEHRLSTAVSRERAA